MAATGVRSRGRTRLAAALIVIGGVLGILLGFVNWALITNPGADDGTLTGWGGIGGVEDMAGENINEVIDSLGGSGSYQPALFTTVLAGAAVLAGLFLIWRRTGVAAGVALACGVGIVAFAVFRGLVPGNVAGIVEDGGTRSGIGPWLVAACGLVIIGGAVVALLDRPPAAVPAGRSRGIQPR